MLCKTCNYKSFVFLRLHFGPFFKLHNSSLTYHLIIISFLPTKSFLFQEGCATCSKPVDRLAKSTDFRKHVILMNSPSWWNSHELNEIHNGVFPHQLLSPPVLPTLKGNTSYRRLHLWLPALWLTPTSETKISRSPQFTPKKKKHIKYKTSQRMSWLDSELFLGPLNPSSGITGNKNKAFPFLFSVVIFSDNVEVWCWTPKNHCAGKMCQHFSGGLSYIHIHSLLAVGSHHVQVYQRVLISHSCTIEWMRRGSLLGKFSQCDRHPPLLKCFHWHCYVIE